MRSYIIREKIIVIIKKMKTVINIFNFKLDNYSLYEGTNKSYNYMKG